MEKKKYNGWTNYETWLVALWIDNEKWYYERTRQFVEETYEAGVKERQELVYELATFIEETLWDELKEMAECTLLGDLAFSALREVNYVEVADGIVEDIEEE